ncbi:MAG: uncharacterized protein PWR01_2893 [Clostridiales bacterium]|jgi:uncharacterized protein (TIGR00251 family)|nr:uncharacterized protein [Clostridiales bacterium]MDN5281820.1 uncharacterized protein [Candidatus Ozemobacter sp.]
MTCSFPCLKETKDGVLLSIYAVPRSSKTEIIDLHDDRCRMKVKAPPVDGEANTALKEALAKIFSIPKKSVILEKGQKGKNKVFLLHGLTLKQANSVLEENFSQKAR